MFSKLQCVTETGTACFEVLGMRSKKVCLRGSFCDFIWGLYAKSPKAK